MNQIKINKGLLAFLYLLAFVLLVEWMIPVMELTETGHISLFLFFILLNFGFSLVGMRWWITVPLKVLYLLWAIQYMFFDSVLFTKRTVGLFIADLFENGTVIVHGQWESLTNPFKTILFFVLLWMTTYLIRHWIEARKNIFLFYFMTVVFIAIIDTFSPYSADSAIVRIMITGLLLIGLLFITRLAEKHDKAIPLSSFTTISLPLAFMVAFSGVVAYVLPDRDPVWPDPIPYFDGLVNGPGVGNGFGGGVSKIGYGNNDSRLGGPFIRDNTLLFEAKVDRKQYWRVETKNTYNTKGWVQSGRSAEEKKYRAGEFFQGLFAIDPEVERKLANIQMVEPQRFFVYPYGTASATPTAAIEKSLSFILNPRNGKFDTWLGDSKLQLSEYDVEYVEQEYSLSELRGTALEGLKGLGSEYEQYLQLPEELPDRVKELAKTITDKETNVYDQAKAIERYFARNGFVYDHQNVPVPEDDQDYVDQFLFDTKRGYCDNFSTSMVVMLRSVGIPARWVKGFAPGQIGQNSEGERVYQVTNNEAHSWVEAYIPEIGWLPFEPTIGFSNNTRINYDIELDTSDPQIPEMKEQQERERPERQETTPVAGKKDPFDPGKLVASIMDWIKDNKWLLITILISIVLVGWQLYRKRGKWIPGILIPIYRSKRAEWSTFEKQYRSLLNQLERFGMKRRIGQTLASYAKEVDRYFGGDHMKRLTLSYEKGLYGNDTVDHDWNELKESWEYLIIRAGS